MRIAYVDFDGASVLKALADGETADTEFLRKYCPKVMTAIDRMAEFIS